jgi:hypothetical protein
MGIDSCVWWDLFSLITRVRVWVGTRRVDGVPCYKILPIVGVLGKRN